MKKQRKGQAQRPVCLRKVEGRTWVDDGYADLARGYLRGEQPDGWEAIDDARARVRGCIDGMVERHEDVNVGVVSHGLALTLYLSGVLGLNGDDAVAIWDSIKLPGVAIFNPEAKRFEREFES